MTSARDQAADAYEEFTGEIADSITIYDLPDHDQAGFYLGETVGIAYKALRDGETDVYYHEFAEEAAPSLVASHDGDGLYLLGGDFHVKPSHGIVDNMPAIAVLNPHQKGKKKEFINMAAAKSKPKTAPKRKPAQKTAPKRKRKSGALTQTKTTTIKRYRRNPSGRNDAFIASQVVQPLTMAAGGLIAKALTGLVPLDVAKSGIGGAITKTAIGQMARIGINMAFKRNGRRVADSVAAGATAAAIIDLAEGFLMAMRVPMAGLIDTPNLEGLVDTPNLAAYNAAVIYPEEVSFSAYA